MQIPTVRTCIPVIKLVRQIGYRDAAKEKDSVQRGNTGNASTVVLCSFPGFFLVVDAMFKISIVRKFQLSKIECLIILVRVIAFYYYIPIIT